MKKIISLIAFAIVIMTSSSALAQSSDRNTFSLRGPVKAVIYEDSFENLYFDKNGTFVDPNDMTTFNRDKSGRIIDKYVTNEKYSYKYNINGNVAEVFYSGGTSYYETTKYTYNAKGLPIKEAHSGSDDNFTLTFKYHEIDSYGNWTKRTVTNDASSWIETREIEYYD